MIRILHEFYYSLDFLGRFIYVVYAIQFSGSVSFCVIHLLVSKFKISRIFKFTFSVLIPIIGYYYLFRWFRIAWEYNWEDY